MSTDPPPPPAAAAVFRQRHAPGHLYLADRHSPLIAFTTRLGGVSDAPYESLNLGLSTGDTPERVAENRRRLCRALGLDEIAFVRQVHGAALRVACAGGGAGEGDVLATTRSDLALAVSTADCLGVVIWDEARTALAVAHAGWRGTLAGAAETALDWLARTRPGAGLRVALGPALRACCFAVGPEVAVRFPAECVERRGERLYLDLARAVSGRLFARGVDPSSVADTGLCTSCTPGLFYSHRRDAGRTGRHWAVARLQGAS